MVDPVVVDAPTFFPNCCIQCKQATGPLVDTHIEDRNGLRIYVCASCVRLDAIALGLVRGKRHAELLNAMKASSDDQRFAEAAQLQAAEASAQYEAEQRSNQQLRDELANAYRRIEQLEGTMRAEAEAALAVVGAGA